MSYTHKLTLDLNAKPHSITMYIKQGDTSRQLQATVVADGAACSLNGCTAILHVDDDSSSVEVATDTNVVTLPIPGTETAGMKCGDIAIVKNGVILSTANFKVSVIKSPI